MCVVGGHRGRLAALLAVLGLAKVVRTNTIQMVGGRCIGCVPDGCLGRTGEVLGHCINGCAMVLADCKRMLGP